MTGAAQSLQQAFDAFRQGDLDGANALCTAVLKDMPQSFEALHLLGVIAFQKGAPQQAATLFEKAVAVQPENASARGNLGAALETMGQWEAALDQYERAIALAPNANTFLNRGNVLGRLRRTDAALASYEQAIALQPAHADAYLNAGNLLREMRQSEKALAFYERGIAAVPRHAGLHNNRGIALKDVGRLNDAGAAYDAAIALDPALADAHYNRGNALRALLQERAALESYDGAIAARPSFAAAHNNRGNALRALRRLPEALAAYEHAIAHAPGYAEAFYNRGALLGDLQRHDAAVASYDQAIALQPHYPEAYTARGVALREVGRQEEARASHVTALRLAPDLAQAHWDLALWCLQNGRFAEGWQEYQWRWKNADLKLDPRNFPQPIWGGEDIRGKTILLHAEQGLGDTLQACRYAPLVASFGARVILEVQEPLAELMKSLAGVAAVIINGQPLPAFDVHCPLLSLPGFFKTETTNIPAADGYLVVPKDHLAIWQSKLGTATARRVGIVWRGNASHKNDLNRSIPLPVFLKALPPGLDYINLQKDLTDEESDLLRTRTDIKHVGDSLRDFSDTAAVCTLADIVITVDTSVAHLAGALGRAFWVMLPFNPDWRWLLQRTDSPWYTGAKLYRQETPGDWTPVTAQVSADLMAFAGTSVTAEAHNEHGIALYAQGDFQGAIVSYSRAIALKPDLAVAFINRGVAYRELEYLAAALADYDRALTLDPHHAGILNNRGIAFSDLGRYADALRDFEAAIALQPDSAEAYYNRGATLTRLNRHTEALASYERAIAIRPHYAEAYNGRGLALRDLGRPEDAIASHRDALTVSPDMAQAHWSLSFALLQVGNFAEGWREQEWRWRTRELKLTPRAFAQPLWHGTESLQGKTILLHAEQGFGDTLQFCRYATLVSERGANVLLEVPAPLVTLLRGLEGVAAVIATGDPLPAFDLHCPLASLPLAFGTDEHSIPFARGYLKAPPEKTPEKGTRRRIGIVWRGNAVHKNDHNRSIPLSDFLTALPAGLDYVSLQKDLTREEEACLTARPDIHHLGDALHDFSDTAAALASLDVIVSVDTSVVHLAGALGRPVWILLPFNPDWRWLLNRADSPWYASAILYRQQGPSDWASALSRIATDLAAFAADNAAP